MGLSSGVEIRFVVHMAYTGCMRAPASRIYRLLDRFWGLVCLGCIGFWVMGGGGPWIVGLVLVASRLRCRVKESRVCGLQLKALVVDFAGPEPTAFSTHPFGAVRSGTQMFKPLEPLKQPHGHPIRISDTFPSTHHRSLKYDFGLEVFAFTPDIHSGKLTWNLKRRLYGPLPSL